MPLPFVGRAGKGGGKRIIPVVGPSISIDAFPLEVGTKQITIRGTGITHIGWSVFANSPPGFAWYGGGADNVPLVDGAAVVTVTTFAAGDRVKAFKSAATGGASARDLSVSVNSDYAVAAPGGQPGSTGPAAILSRMGLGINQERFTASDGGHAGNRTPAYYQRYRDLGVRHIRFFPPVGDQEWQIPINPSSVGAVQPYLDCAMACTQSGMGVTHFDMSDVQGYETMGSALYDYVQAVAERVAEMSFPVDRFIVGGVNEYGGGNNAVYQPHRFTINARIRAALPNHTIVENPCDWGAPKALVYPNQIGGDGAFGTFVPWSDANSMVQIHHYLDWDVNGLAGLFEDVHAWSQANGRKVFIGEHGFDGFQWSPPDNIGRWIERMDEHSQQVAVARLRPTLWAVTDGNDWRLNDRLGNNMRPGLDSGVPRWAGRINTLNAGASEPIPEPVPPPPPPTGGDKLNIVLRGQSNALRFADAGGAADMRNRIQDQTGRTVNLNYAWGDNGNFSIFSGTTFLPFDEREPGWAAGGQQESLRLFLEALPAGQKDAPFLFLWMHNESDSKRWSEFEQADWVAAVRADATIMRTELGLSAANSRYFFAKVKYPGDPTKIFAGMAELAADSSFNAVVSDAPYAAAMDYDPGNVPGDHMSNNDAFIISPLLANEIAALYP